MQASTIKSIVKEALKKKGISLVALAREVGVSYSHLRAVLDGVYTSRPVIQRISEILGLPDLLNTYEHVLKMRHGGVERKRKISTRRKSTKEV